MTISVVVPVYQCASCLKPLVTRIKKSLSTIKATPEIILVDDGSTDSGWEEIVRIAERDKTVTGLRLSRNFGQHRAITAGIEAVTGDYVVVMDCDLQDRPEEIPALYRKIKEGYATVYARRKGRNDGWDRKLVSQLFHRFFGWISGMETDPSVGNFSITTRQVIEAVRTLKEQNRSYLQALKWVGFSHAYLNVRHDQRLAGTTTYTFNKLLSYALDSLTAHSDKPLKIAIVIGFILAIFSFVAGLFVFVRALVWGIPITGWASLFVSLYFLAGLFFMYLGVLGLYLGKLFAESKKRPLFIIAEKTAAKRRAG